MVSLFRRWSLAYTDAINHTVIVLVERVTMSTQDDRRLIIGLSAYK